MSRSRGAQYRERFKRKSSDTKDANNRKVDKKFGYKGPSSLPATPLREQADLVKYIPPGANIWKSRAPGSWNARLPPFGYHSRSIKRYGEDGAIREILRAVWDCYLVAAGAEPSECPVQGLHQSPSGVASSNF